ncbi:MAG: hypothetical protein Q8P31_02450 [Bacillota bacterium]|nr:hypothetical protein [Bacillota bacterium]
MRRWFPLLLVPLLLLSLAAPALGADHRETAMIYLKARYDAPEDEIQLFEGAIIDLELTGESFWCAKYAIGATGSPASGGIIASPPGTEPGPLPAPDTQSKPAIRPLPPDCMPDDPVIYGALYIRLKTGDVLEMDEAERFFAAENALAEREWERLRAEAGKLDVSLYLKLKKVAPDEKVAVWIQPSPVITDGLRAQFAALKAKYPNAAGDMNLEDLFGYARASILPAIGRAISTEATVAVEPVPGSTTEGSVGSGSSGQATGAPPPQKPGADTKPDEEHWREYEAFWQGLGEIQVKAMAPSLADIKAALEDLGAAYKDSGNSLTADLTAAGIQALAALPAVSAILEDMVFTTMDDVLLMGRGSNDTGTTGGAAPPVTSKAATGESTSPTNASPAVYATAVVLAGGLMAYGLRAVNSRRK